MLIFLYSCNSSNVNQTSSELIPLSKGNRWNYEYDHELNPKSSAVEIKNVKSSGETVTAVFGSFPYLGFFDNDAIIIKGEDGSYKLDYPQSEDFMFIPPSDKIKTGYQWKSGEWICNIENEKEDVIIAGKTYSDCLHINFSASITFWGEMWIKKGVGIVKWAFNRTNPPTTELGHYLLKSYSLN